MDGGPRKELDLVARRPGEPPFDLHASPLGFRRAIIVRRSVADVPQHAADFYAHQHESWNERRIRPTPSAIQKEASKGRSTVKITDPVIVWSVVLADERSPAVSADRKLMPRVVKTLIESGH